jgi:hypothetical protein
MGMFRDTEIECQRLDEIQDDLGIGPRPPALKMRY